LCLGNIHTNYIRHFCCFLSADQTCC